MKLVTEPVGKLLCEEGTATNGYYIIVQGHCTKHVGLTGSIKEAMKEQHKLKKNMAVLEDTYPRYLVRKFTRIGSTVGNEDEVITDL